MKCILLLLLINLISQLSIAQPVISNVSPATGTAVNASGNVSFSCSVTGTYPITQVSFTIPMCYDVANDNYLSLWYSVGVNTSGSTWSATWTGANIPAGNFSLIVIALDNHGGITRDTIKNLAVSGLGIGTNDAQGYALGVKGNIICEGAYVKLHTNWPDYVFNSDYQLPDLDSLAKYVQDHQHLPGIPSAKEIGRDGIDLGKNQTALLQKVEELTLYLIEANKKLKAQQIRISRLERRLSAQR